MIKHSPYANDPEKTRGRRVKETEDPLRTPHGRDRDRIIHSGAFRKLQYKTQVFLNHEGDYYRTRLTHSMEVSQVTRSLCRSLSLNEDLGEAIALAHDLGHTPFGHAGERALSNARQKEGKNAFNHNEQTMRVVIELERSYPNFDGLNLTFETIDGLVKHNGIVENPSPYIKQIASDYDIDLLSPPSIEAQIAAISDDLAYCNHDMDDGLRAGILTIDGLRKNSHLIEKSFQEIQGIDKSRLRPTLVRRTMSRLIHDLTQETQKNLGKKTPIMFSSTMAHDLKELKAYLYDALYNHTHVKQKNQESMKIIKDLFSFYLQNKDAIPKELHYNDPVESTTQVIAGMTDRYAIKTHKAYS